VRCHVVIELFYRFDHGRLCWEILIVRLPPFAWCSRGIRPLRAFWEQESAEEAQELMKSMEDGGWDDSNGEVPMLSWTSKDEQEPRARAYLVCSPPPLALPHAITTAQPRCRRPHHR
jgi:hypothetical protein